MEHESIYESIENELCHSEKPKKFDMCHEVLELHTSGLTFAQIQFIFSNCDQHNFAVNILGAHKQK